ncbi:hypothetical protein E2C01_085338 [Portunus trituberculatus]|uniref:Uncharacterized protein n=1 Tax=Portunus trituberculatus TaxID=210409 RepID=A0A5B7JA71_PORTR|nr:hypothetical protein [Portunus trituberculatus]
MTIAELDFSKCISDKRKQNKEGQTKTCVLHRSVYSQSVIDTRVTVAVAAAPLGGVRVTARGRRPVASGNRPVVKDSGRHSGRQLPSRPSVLLTSHNDSLRSLAWRCLGRSADPWLDVFVSVQ